MLKVIRSPAKKTWLIKFGSRTVHVSQTKKEADSICEDLNRKYGYSLQAL